MMTGGSFTARLPGVFEERGAVRRKRLRDRLASRSHERIARGIFRNGGAALDNQPIALAQNLARGRIEIERFALVFAADAQVLQAALVIDDMKSRRRDA